MPPPNRRITSGLRAVLTALRDPDDALPVTRTASEVAAGANISASTAGDILTRLTTDGHLDTGLTAPGDRSRTYGRPMRTYRLNHRGANYARAVLDDAGVATPAHQPTHRPAEPTSGATP